MNIRKAATACMALLLSAGLTACGAAHMGAVLGSPAVPTATAQPARSETGPEEPAQPATETATQNPPSTAPDRTQPATPEGTQPTTPEGTQPTTPEGTQPATPGTTEAGSPFRPAPHFTSGPLRRVPTGANEVVLTFDDGPTKFTEEIAVYLHEQGIPAAFFWLGAAVTDPIRERVLGLGHQLGSHTMTHARLTLLDDDLHLEEISRSREAIGGDAYVVHHFRPPFGAYNEKTITFARALGMDLVMWDVDSRDWELAGDPDKIIDNVMAKVRPGSIILLHERAHTVEILPKLIEALRSAGYTFSSLPQ